MTPGSERVLAHARAVRARGAAMPPDGLPPPDILDSWVRCTEAGLDIAAAPRIEVVDGADLARRRDQVGLARQLALAELETLMQQIAGSNFLLAFADHDGVILDLYADNRFRRSSDAGIVQGSLWAEDMAGTNGLGTALACGRSVAINGLEHYFFELGDISCTATPIRDAQGRVVGVLDASSYYESRQRHTQALVQMAATHIENLLLVQQTPRHRVLAIHPRQEFLGTLSAGLLALDDAGRVSAFNASAAKLLVGLELTRGTAFDELFDEPFERFVARLGNSASVPLRDVLGSALRVSLVNGSHAAPAPPRLPGSLPTAPHRVGRRLAVFDAATVVDVPARAESPASMSAPFVAEDAAVQRGMQTVAAAVRMHVPVLICGETGTGKELLARWAHDSSQRAARGSFVAVNCAALPAELFEAELFGYSAGAFTGARREGNLGLIASADGGTLLLDEIGELALPAQAALLRFLDDQQLRPLGAVRSRQVNVQLLAATHIDLDAAVAARRFRADLLHRLNTVRVELPPLRLRSDFAALARAALDGIARGASLDEAAMALLASQAWSGNMRELRSVLTRALLAASHTHLTHSAHLTNLTHLTQADVARVLPATAAGAAAGRAPVSALQLSARDRVWREFEHHGRSVSATSRALGISRTTVYRYLRQRAAIGR